MKTLDQNGNTWISCKPSLLEIWLYRVFALILIGLLITNHQLAQSLVDETWQYCTQSWIFQSVYFETFWQAVTFLPISFVPFMIDKISYFDKYKIDPNIRWKTPGICGDIVEGIIYVSPLMILDTFTVKKYTNVDPSEWTMRRQNWIQYTRALPADAPTIFQITYQLVIAILLYDFAFGLLHYSLHKNRYLYKYIHAFHHDHQELHTRITNQLTVTERIMLILFANQALKVIGSHPLTRVIFVPIFQIWLVDNHCGYSFPWGLEKLMPFGFVAGSEKHYAHHVYGDRHYAPFFTYVDKFILRGEKTKNID